MEYGELALFRGITNGEVDAMIHCFHMRQARYESGQTICTYGEGGGEVGVLIRGHAALVRLAEPRKELAALVASLDAMSPLKVLGRGFALVTNNEGKPLRRTEDAPVGSQIAARLSNGRLVCRVEESITEEKPS